MSGFICLPILPGYRFAVSLPWINDDMKAMDAITFKPALN
jgi:hypothetical protein